MSERTQFTAVASSAAAPWKFGVLLLAGLNAAVFHVSVYRTVGGWDLHVQAPWPARAGALVSAMTWLAVLTCGRLLAYV